MLLFYLVLTLVYVRVAPRKPRTGSQATANCTVECRQYYGMCMATLLICVYDSSCLVGEQHVFYHRIRGTAQGLSRSTYRQFLRSYMHTY